MSGDSERGEEGIVRGMKREVVIVIGVLRGIVKGG